MHITSIEYIVSRNPCLWGLRSICNRMHANFLVYFRECKIWKCFSVVFCRCRYLKYPSFLANCNTFPLPGTTIFLLYTMHWMIIAATSSHGTSSTNHPLLAWQCENNINISETRSCTRKSFSTIYTSFARHTHGHTYAYKFLFAWLFITLLSIVCFSGSLYCPYVRVIGLNFTVHYFHLCRYHHPFVHRANVGCYWSQLNAFAWLDFFTSRILGCYFWSLRIVKKFTGPHQQNKKRT